jgi:hypothetical protein
MRGSLFDHAIYILLFLMLLVSLPNKGQPKIIAKCQNKGYSVIRLCNFFRYPIGKCVNVNPSYDVRNYYSKSVFCPHNQKNLQKVLFRYKINQYIYVYTKIMSKYICLIGNIYGLYSTCSEIRKNQSLAQYTGVYIPPPPRNHVTGARQQATNESKTCSRSGVKQQQQHAREGGGAVYTASSLTFSVNSVRCTETCPSLTLLLEKAARILLDISFTGMPSYSIKDISTVVSAEKALPKHPRLFFFSGTNVCGLRSFACDLSLPTKELFSKVNRGKSSQNTEIISVPICVIKMSDPTPPREENSHGKPSIYVGRNYTHSHFPCPNVLVILSIYQYINACYHNYSPFSPVMCLYINRFVYMFCVLALLNMVTPLSSESYVLHLDNYIVHSYTQPKTDRVFDRFYLFSICDSSRRYGE